MRFSNYVAVALLAVLLAVVALYHNAVPAISSSPESASSPVCINPPDCNEYARLAVNFSISPVQIEEEIFADLTLKKGWELKRAWIEGVNMYMGKTKAFVENKNIEKGQARVVFFLGSCREPTMHWQLKTEWEKTNKNVNSRHSVFANFDFYTELN